MEDQKNSKKYIQSVERAMNILSFLADEGEARLNEISQRIGLKPTTTFGLLQTLEHTGYIARCDGKMDYCLGLNSLRLGLSYTKKSGLKDMIHRLLVELVAKVDETAYFEIKVGDQYYYYDVVLSSQPLKVVPDEDHFITLPDQSAVAKMFREYDSGLLYATDLEGVTKGLNCFAAPYVMGGTMIGCIALTGPSNRFTAEHMEEAYKIYRAILEDLHSLEL